MGTLFFDGEVLIEGRIDGEVRCRSLRISANGAVAGLIAANYVEVFGEATGSIYGGKIVLGTSCNVEAEIYHSDLVLESGCYFEGKSRRYADPLRLAKEKGKAPQRRRCWWIKRSARVVLHWQTWIDDDFRSGIRHKCGCYPQTLREPLAISTRFRAEMN